MPPEEGHIAAAAGTLCARDRVHFYALCMHGVDVEAEKTAHGIWLSNAYPTDEEPEERGAIFRIISRINHSCVRTITRGSSYVPIPVAACNR